MVALWEDYLREDIEVTPYGDYYAPAVSDHGDGSFYVWETFVDPFVLRDGSPRDMSNDINVVFDIVHGYELDIEDITELLEFRVALVPKTWTDNYGDTIKKTAHEVSNVCIYSVFSL